MRLKDIVRPDPDAIAQAAAQRTPTDAATAANRKTTEHLKPKASVKPDPTVRR